MPDGYIVLTVVACETDVSRGGVRVCTAVPFGEVILVAVPVMEEDVAWLPRGVHESLTHRKGEMGPAARGHRPARYMVFAATASHVAVPRFCIPAWLL